MKYGELNLGQIEALINKLGGMEKMRRILSGEIIVKMELVPLKVWKTIKLGTGLKTADNFRRALRSAGCEIGNKANEILDKPAFCLLPTETEVDLVVISAKDLGFDTGATRKEIYDRAREFGLDFCSAEVGPQLRLQYTDQPEGEWLQIGMQPIKDSAGDIYVFNVAKESGVIRLYGSNGDLDEFLSDDDLWVFVSRK